MNYLKVKSFASHRSSESRVFKERSTLVEKADDFCRRNHAARLPGASSWPRVQVGECSNRDRDGEWQCYLAHIPLKTRGCGTR
jgi:hypothetical protein